MAQDPNGHLYPLDYYPVLSPATLNDLQRKRG